MSEAEPNAQPFVWQTRVYWEDTDGGGVMFHSRYLNHFERARTEWLRARGVSQGEFRDREGLVFAIRHMDIDWLGPARLDDVLDVSVQSVQASGARMRFDQAMRRASDQALLARASVTAVCIDADSFKPVRTPAWITTEINHVE